MSGAQGEQGIPGEPGSTVEVVNLCPSISGAYPEILFKIDGALYAVYYAPAQSKSHLVLVSPGSYVTTDGRNCHFTVQPDGVTVL